MAFLKTQQQLINATFATLTMWCQVADISIEIIHTENITSNPREFYKVKIDGIEVSYEIEYCWIHYSLDGQNYDMDYVNTSDKPYVKNEYLDDDNINNTYLEETCKKLLEVAYQHIFGYELKDVDYTKKKMKQMKDDVKMFPIRKPKVTSIEEHITNNMKGMIIKRTLLTILKEHNKQEQSSIFDLGCFVDPKTQHVLDATLIFKSIWLKVLFFNTKFLSKIDKEELKDFDYSDNSLLSGRLSIDRTTELIENDLGDDITTKQKNVIIKEIHKHLKYYNNYLKGNKK